MFSSFALMSTCLSYPFLSLSIFLESSDNLYYRTTNFKLSNTRVSRIHEIMDKINFGILNFITYKIFQTYNRS